MPLVVKIQSMKTRLLNILTVSLILTLFAYALDSDPVISGPAVRLMEAFYMLTLIYAIVAGVYFSSEFFYRRFQTGRKVS